MQGGSQSWEIPGEISRPKEQCTPRPRAARLSCRAGPGGDQHGCRGAGDLGAVGAVGPGWGRSGRPRGSGEALRCAQSGVGSLWAQGLEAKQCHSFTSLKNNQDESHVK